MIGFIGLGNMASAIIGGLLKKKLVLSNEILGTDKLPEAVERCKKEYGIETASTNTEVASGADVLFLAVKPQFFPEVIAEIKDAVREDTVVVSIAAGKTMASIEELFGRKIKLVRCMPNTPALVLEGCTAVVQGELVSDGEMEYVKELLKAFGTVSEVQEKMIDIVVGISGRSPRLCIYVYRIHGGCGCPCRHAQKAGIRNVGPGGARQCKTASGNGKTSR